MPIHRTVLALACLATPVALGADETGEYKEPAGKMAVLRVTRANAACSPRRRRLPLC